MFKLLPLRLSLSCRHGRPTCVSGWRAALWLGAHGDGSGRSPRLHRLANAQLLAIDRKEAATATRKAPADWTVSTRRRQALMTLRPADAAAAELRAGKIALPVPIPA
eukprot:365459-Chlamydomonas_euryale.AAC.4